MKPELWGGIECTVNRVGSRFFDQSQRTGHDGRLEDLDRFAELGIRTLRYPVLWERVQPNGPDDYDWKWSDQRLSRLRALGIRPIVGLLHHGSGPGWTNLLDPEFPKKFARFAQAVARRYPWIDAYTPVNEPLTTARFSGLYGHWYPHHKDDRSFTQALMNQVEAVVLGMRAIRSVVPEAQLVQTEDLGKAFSTPQLRAQAQFENERRWITFDLLTGRLVQGHPLWQFFLDTGMDQSQAARLAERPCPPDIFGINYYVNSERFLDEHLENYPAETHGGNCSQRYADVDAVRARPEGLVGVGSLMRVLWTRYRSPIAVTEVQMGCTREEQIRWLMEIWDECCGLVQEGIDCRAVTAWALLGAYDWSSLVTEERNDYESGAYDVRYPEPRPTAVARVLRTLAAGETFHSPILEVPGWWRRDDRLPKSLRAGGDAYPSLPGAPILILAGDAELGLEFRRVCENRGLACQVLQRFETDLGNLSALRHLLAIYSPWAIINASGQSVIEHGRNGPAAIGRSGRRAVAEVSLCDANVHLVNFVDESKFENDRTGRNPSCLYEFCHAVLDLLIDAEVGQDACEAVLEPHFGAGLDLERRLAS